MNTLLHEFNESLKALDDVRSQFAGHPMYNEWLDPDEVNVMCSVFEDDDTTDDQSDREAECQYADLIEVERSHV